MRFCDLGTLQAEIGREKVPVKGRLATVLSTLLLHVNRRVPVDLLLDAIWGDEATAQSVGTLETHVWRLRQLLEPDRRRGHVDRVLLNDSGGYRLVADSGQVDSVRFEQLSLDALDMITTAQPDRALQLVDEALGLWRGDPYELLADRVWAAGPIARLLETRAQLQERRVMALIDVGRPEQAVIELEPLLVERPLHEKLWAHRMVALHRLGRTEDALRTYRAARRTLLDEIGLEPGRELVELEQRILRDDVDLRVPVPAARGARVRPVTVRLPRPRTLLGREEELAALGRLLGVARLVTVVGAAGCGKTVLATEVARAGASAFPDGVWFVDLSAADADSDVAALVAVALDLVLPDGGAAATLESFAAERRALVVLDNCEQVLDQVVQVVERWTEQDQQVSVLTTSREPLGTAAEEVFALAPLAVGDVRTGAAPAIGDEPAVALFLASARLGADLEATALAEVRRICRAVDGLPLAIELAAALTPTYPLEEIADEVESDPGQLAAVGRGPARHHQTMTAAVERSYRLLGPAEQLLHRRLAVLTGPFGREVAEAVAEPGSPLTSSLARLVHASLLSTAHVDGRTRFTQLAPIRSHAAHVLRARGEHEATEELRDVWLSDLVLRRPRAGRPEHAAWQATLLRELPTVRSTLSRRLASPADPTGPMLVSHLTGFWYYQDLLEEGVRWAEAATVTAVGQDLAGVSARLALASMLAMRSRADQSRGLACEVLAVLEQDVGPGLRLHGQDRPLTPPQQVHLAELLLAAASAFSVTRDAEMMRRALLLLEQTGLTEDDVDLALVHDATSCLARAVEGTTSSTLAEADAVFSRAGGRGNAWAGWLAASAAASVALERRDPEVGQRWSRRVLDQQSRSGARTMTSQVETLGDFLALDGQLVAAVQVFSATHHQARRVGHPWPRNPVTTELLDLCQARLRSVDFNAAWAVGPVLERRELIRPTTG